MSNERREQRVVRRDEKFFLSEKNFPDIFFCVFLLYLVVLLRFIVIGVGGERIFVRLRWMINLS